MSDIVPLASLPLGLPNRFYNGNCALNPEGTESGADGSTCFLFYTRLSQSANTQTSQIATPEAIQATAMRQTQTSATAQRMGVCQTIDSLDCQDLRTSPLRFSARVRFSEDAHTMYAVLAWAGTADTSPADPVNDWTSTNYAPGGFFKSSYTVLGCGVLSATAETWATTPYISMQAGADLNNIVGMIWTENTAAQNATLDTGQWQIIPGVQEMAFEHRPYLWQVDMESDDGPFVDLASAATTTLASVTTSNKIRITGTTTITSFGTAAAGVSKLIRFAGALTLTHNGTSLILPGAQNIKTAANDCCTAVSLGSGNWIVVGYQRGPGFYPTRYEVDYPSTAVAAIAGDGVTDDTAAVATWLAQAAAAGIPANGLKKTYLVDSVEMLDALIIRDATIKVRTPGVNAIGIHAEDVSGWQLLGVVVDRNGDGSSGGLDSSFGILAEGDCREFKVIGCEVFGDDKGTGICFRSSCSGWTAKDNYVHDMRYVHTSETDDQVQGFFVGGENIIYTDNEVYSLGRTDLTSADRDRYSRGHVFGGLNQYTISGNVADRVDQGFDTTGSAGNINGAYTGNTAHWCYSVGHKWANTAIAAIATGNVADQCGLAGYVVSAPDSTIANVTRNVGIRHNVARNIGTNQEWAGTPPAGVKLDRNSAASPLNEYPKAINVNDNDIFSDVGSSEFSVFDTNELQASTVIPLEVGVRVRLSTTGTLPSPFATLTDYWIAEVTDSSPTRFGLATSFINAQDGTVITGISGGSGTHTITLQQDCAYKVYSNVTVYDSTAPSFAWDNSGYGMTTGEAFQMAAPVAIAYNSATQSIPDAGVTPWTDITTNTDQFDPLGIIAAGVVTIPWPGFWRIVYRGEFAPNATGIRRVRAQANTGGGYSDFTPLCTDNRNNVGASVETSVYVEVLAQLARGVLVKFQAQQNSTGALNLGANASSIAIYPMGPWQATV